MARSGNIPRNAPSHGKASQKTSPAAPPQAAIIGGGMAGLTLAALLARGGVPTLCLDRESRALRARDSFDGRTMALTWGSRQILERAGLWPRIASATCPIRTVRAHDREAHDLLHFAPGDNAEEPFGWVVEIGHIRAALFDLADAEPLITHLAPARPESVISEDQHRTIKLATGQTFSARLVVGADGRASFTRAQAGVPVRAWSYGQRAVVCTVTHERPHGDQAIEHFHPQGPFALLPMTDGPGGTHRSTAVWVEESRELPSAAEWNDDLFALALAARMPAEYGAVRQVGPRFAYPLGLVHARHYIAPRLALVGDAAHGLHPLAGQGLNLGLRDVAALADLVVEAHRRGEDIGAPALLRRYQQARRFDTVTMTGAMDTLNRLFSSGLWPMGAARRMGMRLVQAIPPARHALMNRLMGRS